VTPNIKVDKDVAASVLAVASTENRASVFNVWFTLASKVDDDGVAHATAEEIADELDIAIGEAHDVLDLLVEEGLIKPSKKISSYTVPGVQAA
jgi:transcription initiation factor IIE alpha subunit